MVITYYTVAYARGYDGEVPEWSERGLLLLAIVLAVGAIVVGVKNLRAVYSNEEQFPAAMRVAVFVAAIALALIGCLALYGFMVGQGDV